MDDLIKRQDVIDIIMGDGIYCDTYEDKAYSAERIKNIPTVEPRKGKWIEHNPHKWGLGIVFECSECGEEVNCEACNYCPNCGARMEE